MNMCTNEMNEVNQVNVNYDRIGKRKGKDMSDKVI